MHRLISLYTVCHETCSPVDGCCTAVVPGGQLVYSNQSDKGKSTVLSLCSPHNTNSSQLAVKMEKISICNALSMFQPSSFIYNRVQGVLRNIFEIS